MYTVYVIEAQEGYRYTGYTSEIRKRLEQHNIGMSRWTKRGSEWKVIYSEKYESKSDALKRERWLKSGHGREFLKTKLIGS